MYFGHRYTNSLMTFFFLLLRCYVSSVDRVVNWPKWILIKSRYPACNVNVLPGHRIILLPRMEQLNWCNGTFVFLEGGQRYFDEPFCTRYRAVNIPILCIQAASISNLFASALFVGGLSDPGSHRSGQTEDPGFSFIFNLPRAASYS